MAEVTLLLAFAAGLLSFLSPCVLPLYPVFLSYITGMSVSEVKDENHKLTKRSVLHTIFFLIGFSAVFIMIGLMASSLADFFRANQQLIRQVGSILIVIFGLLLAGVFNFKILMKNHQIQFKNRPAGFLGSFLIGMAFSMGWTPCTGPILGAVIALGISSAADALPLMISYVIGFSIPFILLSFFIGKFDWIKRKSGVLIKVGGYMMIVVGVALFFNWLEKLTYILSDWLGFKGIDEFFYTIIFFF